MVEPVPLFSPVALPSRVMNLRNHILWLIAAAGMAASSLHAATGIGVSEPDPPGATSAQVPVSVTSDQPVLAMQVDVLFNDAQYIASEPAADGSQPAGVIVDSSIVQPGLLRVVVYRGSTVSPLGSGVVFRIPLMARSGVIDPDPVVLANYVLAGLDASTLAASLLPKVRLTSVTDQQNLNGRIGIELTVAASASAGTVARVDYYIGDQLLGSGTGANFSLVWFPPGSGPFEITAVAFDSNGNQASSRTVPVMVQHVGTFAGAVKGTFQGLIRTPSFSFARNGYATLTTATNGTVSGKLAIGGENVPASGKFDANGLANIVIPKTSKRPVWQLTLTQSSNASVSQIHGRVTDGTIVNNRVTGGTFVATFTADMTTWNAKTNRPPQAGAYTVLLPASDQAATQGAPLGDAYATATVATSGAISMAGKLSDNTAWSQSTFLSKNGLWPLYSLLYSAKGMAIGELQFRNLTATSDIDGVVDWFRPQTTTAPVIPFKPGFTTQVAAVGSKYVKPAALTHVLKVPNAGGNTMLTLADGGLADPLVNIGTLKTNGTVTFPFQSAEKPTLAPAVTTGALSGAFIHPATQASTKFYGAVLQKQNVGMGYFISGVNGGGFTFEPNPLFVPSDDDALPIGTAPLPTVKFLLPKAESTIPAAASITVTGTAAPGSKKTLESVSVQVLHNGVLTEPALATGIAAWSFNITVPPGDGGRFQVFAKSRDTLGSESDIVEQGFWMLQTTPLVVAVAGPGSVTKGYLGTTQQGVDKLVTITATPASKKKFIGWTGSVVSSSAKITFMMKAGMSVTANFQ